MRVQVITPFHWDGVLRVRGDVIDGDDAALIHDDPHYAALCVPLADDDRECVMGQGPALDAPLCAHDACVLVAGHDGPHFSASLVQIGGRDVYSLDPIDVPAEPVITPSVTPPTADDHQEE